MQIPGKNIKKDRSFISGRGYAFNLGSKFDIEEMYFGFGGGGVNTAITFKKQGFRVAYCGMVGDDIPGKEIIDYLDKQGVETGMVRKTKAKLTNNSVILDNPKEDRTVLSYRGASELLDRNDIPSDLKARWFYLAPLSGKLSNITEEIIFFAAKNRIKTAVNFGNSQLKIKKAKMDELLKRIDILILNKEEAAILTGVDYRKEKDIITRIAEMHNGINVITKGEQGVTVVAGGKIYSAKLKRFNVVDETGAGDALGSGFVSGIMKTNDIEHAIKLGLANAKYAISEKGATTGILSEEQNNLVEKEKIAVKNRSL